MKVYRIMNIKYREDILDKYSDLFVPSRRRVWSLREGLWSIGGCFESILCFTSMCNNQFEELNLIASIGINRRVGFSHDNLFSISFTMYEDKVIYVSIKVFEGNEDADNVKDFFHYMLMCSPFRCIIGWQIRWV